MIPINIPVKIVVKQGITPKNTRTTGGLAFLRDLMMMQMRLL